MPTSSTETKRTRANEAKAKAAKAKAAKAAEAAEAPKAEAPKISAVRASAFAELAPLRDYMHTHQTVAPSPQFHTDERRAVEIRTGKHRVCDATEKTIIKSERALPFAYALRAVFGDRDFPAHGCDNALLGKLRAAGLITTSGGESIIDNGVPTLIDTAASPVRCTLTASGLKLGLV